MNLGHKPLCSHMRLYTELILVLVHCVSWELFLVLSFFLDSYLWNKWSHRAAQCMVDLHSKR